MVVPANVWCTHNGYTQKYNNQGIITELPDYKKALDNDLNLVNVITKIGELMAEKISVERYGIFYSFHRAEFGGT